MKKITKIILPIASVAVIAAPVATLVSCSKADFICDIQKDPTSPQQLTSNTMDVVKGKKYRVSVDLQKTGSKNFTSYHIGSYKSNKMSAAESDVDFDPSLCLVRFGKDEKWQEPKTISGPDISDGCNFDYIEFTVGFKNDIKQVYLFFVCSIN